MTHCYGPIQRQMDPHPKFEQDAQTDDAMHTPRRYERVDNPHNWSVWGEQGSSLQQRWNSLRVQERGAGLFFYCSQRWGQWESSWVWAGTGVVCISHWCQRRHTRAFLPTYTAVGSKGEGEGWGLKVVSNQTAFKKWSEIP